MTPGAQDVSGYQPIKALRGAALACKGWQQEAVLRMLMNSLDPDVAERPQDLVISGATGKAAADWDSFHAIVASLRQLGNDESLLVQSGKPAGVSRTAVFSPRVAATNASGGTMHCDWLYAGTQTMLPVHYEIYGAAARGHFGGTLAGKLVVGGGMGGAGGAQALAAALHGAAFLGIDADGERIKHRVKSGYCEVMVNNLDEALRMLKNAVRQRKSVSIGLIGNCAELFPGMARRGVVPDILTDYTPAEPPFNGYIAAGLQPTDASVAAQRQGARDLERLGTRAVNFAEARDYLRPLFDDGRRLSTWLALSGEPSDIARVDRLALETFPDDEHIQRWLAIVGNYVRFQGLPARVAWLRQRDLSQLGCAVNDFVARGEINAPILFGSRRKPAERAGADPTSIGNGACWTLLSGGEETIPSISNGLLAQAIVADGTADAAQRLAIGRDA